MNSSVVLSTVTFIYGFAGVLYIFAWVFKKPAAGKMATWVAILGLAGNAAGFGLRWVESYQLGFGHAPLSNLYESLVFFAGCITLMAYASLSPNISDRIQPLIPALKSNWLIAHVVTCFIGYGAFAVAFGVSLMYLFKQSEPDATDGMIGRLPTLEALDELTHQLIVFGFLFLCVGIITGAVWANSAWGRYWGWDPKETWSLITWFIYAALLHARLTRGWRGRRIAYLSIIGFAAVLFTYFGVNLLPGLHSYQAMSK
jgi:ABC-type transport system involved in cytochrome c biogenesis permease subunit